MLYKCAICFYYLLHTLLARYALRLLATHAHVDKLYSDCINLGIPEDKVETNSTTFPIGMFDCFPGYPCRLQRIDA